MIAPVAHQSTVFYAAFAREAELLKDDLLEEVSELLDDPELGKTTGYHVPVTAEDQVRAGVEAWHALQECLRELADMNSACVLADARKRRTAP